MIFYLVHVHVNDPVNEKSGDGNGHVHVHGINDQISMGMPVH